MDEMNKMDMMALDDVGMMEKKAMKLAKQLDEKENQAKIEGDYSKIAVNKMIDSLNRVNMLFDAPPFPKVEADLDAMPPALIRNLLMIANAAKDAGMDEYVFDLDTITDDKGLKMLAGKLDAAAGDKSFKAFLAKPDGMATKEQAEEGVPTMQMEGMEVASPARGGTAPMEDEEELFMARMRT